MTVHLLAREQRLPGLPSDVFPFFGDALNLEAITPPWIGFRVTTPSPIAMRAGATIEYRLRLHGLPIGWRTRIALWEPPRRFVDVQLSGPYLLWHHTHLFEAGSDGMTLMRDMVRYALPFGFAGEAAHALLVRRDLARIFDFRAEAVARLLGESGTSLSKVERR